MSRDAVLGAEFRVRGVRLPKRVGKAVERLSEARVQRKWGTKAVKATFHERQYELAANSN